MLRSFFIICVFTMTYFVASAQKEQVKTKTPTKIPIKSSKKNLSLKDLKNIQKLLIKYEALSLSFAQKTYRSLRDTEHNYLGQVYLISTGKFYWQLQPIKKKKTDILIFDGKSLFSFSKGAQYAIRYPADNSKGKELEQLVNMMSDFDSLLTQYSVSSSYQINQEIHLSLIPKSKSEITKVDLVVDLVQSGKNKTVHIKSLVLHFQNKNYTSFKFSNHKKEKVDLSRLKLPKGIKINEAL